MGWRLRFYCALLFFILFSFNSDASWQTYQGDLRNTGIGNGTGYFPVRTANFSNELYGMDFQPLVDDIDNDGYNEIVIFYNDFLKIFDYELNLIDEKYAGTLLGQPTIFNKNIIFNSRITDKNYFSVYQFNNSNLKKGFNITLSNDADFSGIKCLNLNGTNSCIFKDKLNYIHIVNIDSKTDSSYNTSVYEETRQTVPAIGDIDNDGNMEAVFWFNQDNNSGYGFMVFDLVDIRLDTSFNNSGIVDNIFSPLILGPSLFHQLFELKGQPVLVDLNNDNKLEIAASVFYHDNSHVSNDDWYTELFVYSHNGSKLFSKCELSDNDCSDSVSGPGGSNKWEGTNPFVLDYNKDGIKDICFIKDVKGLGGNRGGFLYMALNCYNYSGDEIAKVNLSNTEDDIKGTAMAADMNNDGEKEIITTHRIYLPNGTVLLELPSLSTIVNPIAVDIDGNNRLDLVWTKNGMTKLFVDDTGAVKASDVLIKPENPSVDDSLSCQWKANGNNKIIYANASWYKNNEFYSSEEIQCINSTLCMTINNILSSALNENDLWKCSITAFESSKKSLPKFDTAIILGKNSEWQSFNKNQLSYGISSGNGYFSKSAISAIIYNYSGADFQPMIADIDNNRENEIVVFSNNSLMLLNKSLNIIAQKQVGNLRGQFDIENMDNDPYLEIIAVVNNSNKDYFTIFEFNGSDFKIETSFDVTSQNGYQDIRCLDFDKDGIKECIFRDFNGIVHSYQMNATSQFDDKLNINISDKEDNVYGSNVNIAPSFVDFDRDGDLDALFWFNDNFVVIDANKNVVLNVDVGTLNVLISSEPTFLGLKFVNLDKAGNYEIVVAYRNDNPYFLNMRTEINLSLFNSNGKVIFSKISNFFTENCGSVYHEKLCLGHGSDLFVYDYNKDSFDDIGIYLEGTHESAYGNFIKFFDRNGEEVASNKVEFGEGFSIPQSVTLADIDNDDELELILKRRIYNLDGTAIYNFTDAATKAPIAADIDKNKALDLLWFNSNQIILLLDNNSRKPDLSIEEKDISFQPLNSTSVVVNAAVHNNGGLNLDNVKVKLTNTETLEAVNGAISIKGSNNNNFTGILNLKKNDKVMAQVNYDSSIEEDNDKNNFASREFMGLVYVFVSVDLEPFNVNSVFQDYIKNKLTSGYYTTNENEADVKVYIGKNNPINKVNNIKTLNDFEFGYDYGNIIYNDEIGALPYNGLVGSFMDNDGKIKIMIAGNEIEGDIIGVKEFIKNQPLLLNTKTSGSIFIDDENVDAIKVFDYLHLGGNSENYGINNDAFKRIVRNALNDEMFTVEDKSVVSSNGITLRLRNLKPNASSDYLEYLNSSGVPVEMPVVLSHGLFSNLTTWEVLGAEISNTGRDTWLIEITGGTEQDCDNCIDYTFYNLTDIFVPALLNGVLSFTGKDKIQYVGFSNGCRAALDSLERNMFDSNKVETFVAVGCPGSFDGESFLGDIIRSKNGGVSKRLESTGRNHYTFETVAIAGLFNRNFIPKGGSNKISLSLWKFYEDIINSSFDNQPGNIEIPNFVIIQGSALTSNDGIISIKDEQKIYQNANKNINSKKHFDIFALHSTLDEKDRTKSIIRKSLNKQQLSLYEKTINLINQSN